MISYRQHVVSLVAVFLALATGVVLGGGPLSELGRDGSATAADAPGPREERTLAFAEEFAAAAGPRLYAAGLRQRPVALLTAPGVEEETVTGLTAQVEAAGGSVAGRYDLSTELVSGASKTLVDTLGTQLVEQVDRGLVDAGATTYARIGELLGHAVATAGAPEKPGADAETIRQSLLAAELVTATDEEAGLAPLVLLVLGEESEPTVLAGLVSGLASAATGVVVVADSDSGADGDLAQLREDPAAAQVTTVDGVETVLGQVSSVLALVREMDGTGGAYGASGEAGPVPLG
ncbi:copper transporter [Nocardioides sp. zg-DK7169]|uniref:copper transporter n=1 Tax=Nocardioides sp. zg-DK7169 TaxID=2736600 RepID=UPI00155359A3|nr:copper transporter [Nocardioides sp. zg-DK7169]NPC99016.1 copper transporter [Nocardioides sp. zg-DK7169]